MSLAQRRSLLLAVSTHRATTPPGVWISPASVRASVTDAVEELVDELPRVGRISFRRLTHGLVERLEIVVRFLAVLEMFKQGLVDIEQATTFGEIEIVWLGGVLQGVDSYDG